MDDHSTGPSLPSVVAYDDVDAYRDALDAWDMNAVPLDRGRFRLNWTERTLPDVSVVRYEAEGSIRESYVKAPGSTAMVLMLPHGEAPFRVRGAALDPMTLTMLQPEREYEVVSPAGGQTLEVYLPDEVLAAFGLDRWLDPEVMNVRPDAAAGAWLRDTLSPLVTAGEPHAGRPEATRAGVLEALAVALDSVDTSAPPPPTVRLHATYRRAIARIEADPDPMLTVVELAAQLGVSTRTLRYAFGYGLGISPYQYMLRRRLTMVRSVLLDDAHRHRTVLEILMTHGITHQGEFAGQYRQLFGETPSQTRARVPKWRGPKRLSAAWPKIQRAAR